MAAHLPQMLLSDNSKNTKRNNGEIPRFQNKLIQQIAKFSEIEKRLLINKKRKTKEFKKLAEVKNYISVK